MAFKNDTNAGRVQKMVETLALIEKSARSNRAGKAEVAAMLQPLSQALAALTGEMPATSEPFRSRLTRVPQWSSVRDMAEKAELSDLTVAMAVYLNRIDEALS